MPVVVKSLSMLLSQGLRPSHNRRSGSYIQRDLSTLRAMTKADLRNPSRIREVSRAILLLTRHIEPHYSSIGQRLADLLAVHILYRGADGSAEIIELEGGSLDLPKYKAYLGCVNPLWVDYINIKRELPFHKASRATYTHPVLKVANPFRPEMFAESLCTWWESLPDWVTTQDALITFLFVAIPRSKDVLEWICSAPVKRPILFNTPACLHGLYQNVGIPLSVFAWDGGTIHAATTTLGALIDNILVPYWRQPARHPATVMANTPTAHVAAKALRNLWGVGDLNCSHVGEYLALADKNIGRLRYCKGGAVPEAFLATGSNTNAVLSITEGKASTDPLQRLHWLTNQVVHRLPSRTMYRRKDGSIRLFDWKSKVDMAVVQSNCWELLQVLRTWLTGSAGAHARPKVRLHSRRRILRKQVRKRVKRSIIKVLSTGVLKRPCAASA